MSGDVDSTFGYSILVENMVVAVEILSIARDSSMCSELPSISGFVSAMLILGGQRCRAMSTVTSAA